MNNITLLRELASCWPEYCSFNEDDLRLEYAGSSDPTGYVKVIQGTYHLLNDDYHDARLIGHMMDVIREILPFQEKTWGFVFLEIDNMWHFKITGLIENYSPIKILKGVERHYDGGLKQFLKDNR